jgi:hypothetical protein
VAIEEKYLLRTHFHYRPAKLNHHLDVGHLTDAQCSGKEEMVSRMARPKCWQAHDFVSAPSLNSPRHSSDDIGIGCEREMRAMLFEGAEWEKDDRAVPSKLFDFWPGQVFQEHDGRTVSEIRRNVKRKR